MKPALCTAFAACLLAGTAGATTVTGGALLDTAGADRLEAWLGDGDLDFTNLWSGTGGVSTASEFHTAVDGAGPTFSLYGISFAGGGTAVVGGYTSLDWGGAGGYFADASAFIFNLTSDEVQTSQANPQYAIYRSAAYFPTFGGGHDLFGGYGTLATYGGTASANGDGYAYAHSYDLAQGAITTSGAPGATFDNSWSVSSLEVYAIAPASPVPLPATLTLLMAGLGGLVALRRRSRDA